jgi:hypothetical protein
MVKDFVMGFTVKILMAPKEQFESTKDAVWKELQGLL